MGLGLKHPVGAWSAGRGIASAAGLGTVKQAVEGGFASCWQTAAVVRWSFGLVVGPLRQISFCCSLKEDILDIIDFALANSICMFEWIIITDRRKYWHNLG